MGRLRTKHTGFYHVLDDKLRRAYMDDDGDFAATFQIGCQTLTKICLAYQYVHEKNTRAVTTIRNDS